jgi:hypothetical protein
MPGWDRVAMHKVGRMSDKVPEHHQLKETMGGGDDGRKKGGGVEAQAATSMAFSGDGAHLEKALVVYSRSVGRSAYLLGFVSSGRSKASV